MRKNWITWISDDTSSAINFKSLSTRVAKSEVKCPTLNFPKFPTPTPTPNSYLSKISQSDNNFLAKSAQWKSWYTARILRFNKNFKKISRGIGKLAV